MKVTDVRNKLFKYAARAISLTDDKFSQHVTAVHGDETLTTAKRFTAAAGACLQPLRLVTLKPYEAEALAHVDLTMTARDYQLPYPAMVVTWQNTLICIVQTKKHLALAVDGDAGFWSSVLSLESPDNVSDLLGKTERWTFTDPEEHSKLQDSVTAAITVGLNALQLISPNPINQAQYEVLQKQAKSKAKHKAAKAQQKLDNLPLVYELDQSIILPNMKKAVVGVEGSSGPKCAHWRRGHWRRQRHGKGHSLTRYIFVAPVLVNKEQVAENATATTVYRLHSIE